jgi:hypothetical protein
MRRSPPRQVEITIRSTRAPARRALAHAASALLAAAAAAAAAIACAPSVDDSGCSMDIDCQGRAEVCDVANNVCIPKTVDETATENPAPANFTNKVVPFHRGQVCMAHDVKSGENVPVTLNPCFHPCLDQGAFKHKHYYECLGSRCEAWAILYIEASSIPEGCPADAFGAFDRALCSTGPSVSLSIGTTIDSGPVNGTMGFEIPFLTNADAAAISADFDNVELIKSKIEQYPANDDRVPGGKDIVLSPSNPAPPASCETGCDCYDIGF